MGEMRKLGELCLWLGFVCEIARCYLERERLLGRPYSNRAELKAVEDQVGWLLFEVLPPTARSPA